MKLVSRKEYIRDILNQRKVKAMQEDAMLLKAKKEQEKINAEKDAYYGNILEKTNTHKKYNNFITSVKEQFLGDCIYSIFNESLNIFDRLDEKQEVVKRTLVNNFIQEQDVDKLLSKFRYQNALLSEFAFIVDKAVSEVIESVDPVNINSWTIDTDIKDKFTDDLSNCNSKEAIITITDRVTDAETEFINDNTRRKMEIDEILQSKKEKLDTIKDKSEEIKESVAMAYDRKIKMIKNRPVSSIYQKIAESMTKNALADEELRKIYVSEGVLNMDTLLIDAGIMYTFLEMLYTTEMVGKDYITEFVLNV